MVLVHHETKPRLPCEKKFSKMLLYEIYVLLPHRVKCSPYECLLVYPLSCMLTMWMMVSLSFSSCVLTLRYSSNLGLSHEIIIIIFVGSDFLLTCFKLDWFPFFIKLSNFVSYLNAYNTFLFSIAFVKNLSFIQENTYALICPNSIGIYIICSLSYIPQPIFPPFQIQIDLQDHPH